MRAFISRLPAFLFTMAAAFGLLASLAVFLTAGATQVSQVNGGPQTITHLNWVEAQGTWGILILLIFSALYYAPLRFYTRGQRGMALLFVAASVLLTLLASFSVGVYYWLAALAALLGAAALLLQPGS